MALIKCPHCGKPISDKAVKCPHCGILFNKQSCQNSMTGNEVWKTINFISLAVGGIISIVLLCVIFFNDVTDLFNDLKELPLFWYIIITELWRNHDFLLVFSIIGVVACFGRLVHGIRLSKKKYLFTLKYIILSIVLAAIFSFGTYFILVIWPSI